MNELTIKTVEFKPAVITVNYKEIKAAVIEYKKKYEAMVFSEDDMAGAKEKRADLNKLKKSIDEFRKGKIKELKSGTDEFEKQMKELTSLVDEAIIPIDKQCEGFTKKIQEERKKYARGIIKKTEEKFDVHDLVLEDWYWSKKNSNIAILRDVENQAQIIVDEKERIEKEITLIKNQVKLQSAELDTPLDADFYTKQHDKKELGEILILITNDSQRQKKAEETAKSNAIEAEKKRIKVEEEKIAIKKTSPIEIIKPIQTVPIIETATPIIDTNICDEFQTYDCEEIKVSSQDEFVSSDESSEKLTQQMIFVSNSIDAEKIKKYVENLGVEITSFQTMEW